MLRKISTLLLSGLMMFAITFEPTLAQSAAEEKLRHRVVEWGPNKVVSVQLKSGEKISGRIAEIKDDALSVQYLNQNKIDTRDFRWGEIKKISLKKSTEDKVRKTGGILAIGLLVTIAVVIGVGLSQWE